MTKKRPQAIGSKQLENDRVIITEWRFAPGAETGWHKHGYDYVVVPGLNGNLLLESKDEGNDEEKISNVTAELNEGQSYFKPAGIEHNVVNPNDFEFYFIEVELK